VGVADVGCPVVGWVVGVWVDSEQANNNIEARIRNTNPRYIIIFGLILLTI
jgi:hypothetical protein